MPARFNRYSATGRNIETDASRQSYIIARRRGKGRKENDLILEPPEEGVEASKSSLDPGGRFPDSGCALLREAVSKPLHAGHSSLPMTIPHMEL